MPARQNPANPTRWLTPPCGERNWLRRTRRACKLVTRIYVMIPDLPGLGVFRLDTGSYYAAGEIGDKADAYGDGPGTERDAPGECCGSSSGSGSPVRATKNFPVPVLEILSTFRAIATGALESGGMAAQLPPAPGEQRLAITAPPAAPVTPAAPAPAESQAIL